MTQAEDRLKGLFAQGQPPARDPVFATAVMERVMRRRFQEDVALLCVVSLVAGAAFWLVWPALQPALLAISQGLAPALGAAALAVCAIVILGGRPSSDLGLGT
jgi:hypothetical protein